MDVRLDGETRLFPIIGDPIGQVKSPAMLTEILVQRGVNALVVPVHVASADVPAYMDALKKTQNVDGLIITVPHKVAALGHCDVPSERAQYSGSCNVMRRLADGRWSGDNTDGQGFMDGVEKEGFSMEGKRALLIGCGGAGSAIAYEILARGAAHLAIHDADSKRRDGVVARLAARFPGKVSAGSADPSGFDFIGNATPVGMKTGDPWPVDVAGLHKGQFVACVITRPDPSPLVAHARALGCATMPGVGMFHAQAELLVDSILGTGAAT